MSRDLNEETVRDFIKFCIESDDTDDFGYLLIPDDERLNNEALSILKTKFKTFVESN